VIYQVMVINYAWAGWAEPEIVSSEEKIKTEKDTEKLIPRRFATVFILDKSEFCGKRDYDFLYFFSS